MPASAQDDTTVRHIRIEGLQRSSPDTVRTYLLIREGDAFDPDRIDRSLKSLFATGRFADVKINREGGVLVVQVVENPTVNRVAFEGNRKIDDETLTSEVTLKPLGVYTQSKVQSDVRRILTLYRRSGRFGATIEPKIIELEQNRVDVVFEIDEGEATYVENIRFIGNTAFDDGTLRSEIRTKQSRWWRFFSTEDTYDPDRLTLDRELLRRFYLSEGYADFQVLSAVAELTPDRESFEVTFTVQEGERYKYGEIAFTSAIKGLEIDKVRGVVEIEQGDWYDANAVEKAIDDLTEAVNNEGFAFVEVQPRLERNREERTIGMSFAIEEGRRVFIERIDITGNVRTLDRVIRREFRLAEGDAYSAAKLRRTRQRIKDLDYFESVNLEEYPGSAPDQAIVKVDVAEKPTGSLSIGAGFSTGSGFLGDLSIRERNLLGRGQDLKASLLLGQRQQQIDLAFTEPYFLGREVSAGADVFLIQVDRQRESSFDSRTIGGALRANYPISEHLSQGWRYTFKRSEIDDVDDDASRFIKAEQGSEYVSEISHSLTYDRRDSRINPSDGYFGRIRTDFAGLGGTVEYVRNRVDGGYYYSIVPNWVASLNGSFGHIDGIGEDVRVLDRFFLGGAELRGFATDGVGPRDSETDDALGGEFLYTASLQLSFPLGLPEELQIRGRVFTDVGSLWDVSNDDPIIDDESSPRMSVGTGLTWVSPFGPLGVDFGYAVIKEDFDDTEIIRVNFGTRF
ncbi:MAG: outer membrane protein assembly factor BamA [Hyphomicrobiales bacterium]|nr:outer membrane protein assembly factor BamA [Hyphomicrobiales bacterium]